MDEKDVQDHTGCVASVQRQNIRNPKEIHSGALKEKHKPGVIFDQVFAVKQIQLDYNQPKNPQPDVQFVAGGSQQWVATKEHSEVAERLNKLESEMVERFDRLENHIQCGHVANYQDNLQPEGKCYI